MRRIFNAYFGGLHCRMSGEVGPDHLAVKGPVVFGVTGRVDPHVTATGSEITFESGLLPGIERDAAVLCQVPVGEQRQFAAQQRLVDASQRRPDLLDAAAVGGRVLLRALWNGTLDLPYPVPFDLLGDNAKGWLQTDYLSPSLRLALVSSGAQPR